MAPYRFRVDVPLEVEVRRVATDQVDLALADLDRDDRDAAVHEVRRRCKKLRALVRLVRGAEKDLTRRENAAFRDLARTVAGIRDDAAAVECFDRLVADYDAVVDPERLAPVRDGLRARREAVHDGLSDAIANLRDGLGAARERIDAWDLHGDGFDLLRGGLERSYRRARSRGRTARSRPSTAAFHEWRKRIKDHRYQVQLLQDCWPRVLRARRAELHELTDLLGDDHDLATLRDTLHADVDRYGGPDLVSACTALIDHRRARLQQDACALGQRCFADRPDPFVARFEAYWQAWRQG